MEYTRLTQRAHDGWRRPARRGLTPRARAAGRATWPATLTLLGAVMLAQDAAACRCAPRTLTDYYNSADIVMIAQVDAIGQAPIENHIALELTPTLAPYKGDPTALSFHTATSSAACGIPPLIGRRYLIFANRDPQTPSQALVNTCQGSRMFDPEVENGIEDFEGVPAARVVGQLEMLQATDAMARFQGTTLPKVHLLGLLDLAPLAHGGHVTLRSAPEESSAIVRIIHSMDDIPHREADYEFAAAMVMDRRQGWYAIALDERVPEAVAWLRAEHAGTYWPLPKLVVNRLNYLTDAWDGLLWTDAAGAGRIVRLDRQAERPAVVKEAMDLAGSTWLRVDVLAASPCEGGDDKVRYSGWIPAWSDQGTPNAWYYSRGC